MTEFRSWLKLQAFPLWYEIYNEIHGIGMVYIQWRLDDYWYEQLTSLTLCHL